MRKVRVRENAKGKTGQDVEASAEAMAPHRVFLDNPMTTQERGNTKDSNPTILAKRSPEIFSKQAMPNTTSIKPTEAQRPAVAPTAEAKVATASGKTL